MFKTDYPITKILIGLDKDNLLPAIVFRTSRRQCDADVVGLSRARFGTLRPEEQRILKQEIENVMQKYDMPREIILDHPQLHTLILTGAGAHHAGQLLMWRLLLEELMTRGVLRLMVATGTVAAGVDFPARSVVITAHSKKGSEGFNVLTATELQQMSGRAGRRGKDSVGFCVVAPGPYADARVIHDTSKLPPEPLKSAYFAAPSTVLNLLKYRNVDDLKYTVSRSLASFLDAKAAKGLQEEAQRREEELESDTEIKADQKKKGLKRVRHMFHEVEILRARQDVALNKTLAALKTLGYLEELGLSSKGSWAAELCTSLVLELSEAIEDGLLEDLTAEELVGLVASIAGDSHRKYYSISQNPIKKEYFNKLQKILDKVRRVYEHPGNAEIAVDPNAALTVITWMNAADWQEYSSLLRLAGVADGDVSRLISQTADHLNQLSRLHESHPDLARLAKVAREQILKPPLVEAELS